MKMSSVVDYMQEVRLSTAPDTPEYSTIITNSSHASQIHMLSMPQYISSLCLRGEREMDVGSSDGFRSLDVRSDLIVDFNHPTSTSICSSVTRRLIVQKVITQGDTGVKALDHVVRECLQLQPGAELKLCVDYRLLRLNLIQQGITGVLRVFLPDHMTLYMQSCDGDGKLHTDQPRMEGPPNQVSSVQYNQQGETSLCVDGKSHMRVSVYQNIISPSVKRAKDHNEMQDDTDACRSGNRKKIC